jgi:hypothetical protein
MAGRLLREAADAQLAEARELSRTPLARFGEPQRGFRPSAQGYHDHTIAVAQEVLGRFALFASLLNAATAIAVFIVDPSYKSVWLYAAIVLPFFVVCLTPAIAVAAVDPQVLTPWRLSSNPLHTIAGRSPFLAVPCGQTSGTMDC